MKKHNYRNGNALILVTACLLFFGAYTISQAISSDTQSGRGAYAESAFKQTATDSANLIVRRIPNLGNHIIANLYIDGVPAAGIGYGRTYEGFLRPGRHVLAVRATPNAKWLFASEITLDVRNGRTYTLTATGNHSGNLVLKED